MTAGRKVLLGTTALCAAAWLPAASAVFLAGVDAYTGSRLWDHFGGVPLAQWWSYRPYAAANASVALWLGISAAVASLPLVGCALAWGYSLLKGAKQPLYGQSDWATRRAVEKGREEKSGLVFSREPAPGGLVLGTMRCGLRRRFVSLVGEEHAALTARTRSGKGVSFVVPNALRWDGSLVCFSVKRDVWDAAAAERTRRGDLVRVFDLSDPSRRTHRWNPLGHVRRGDPATYGDIQRAMWFLVPETKANNPFWDNAARKIATALGVILAETPGVRLTVGVVLDLVRRPDYDAALRRMIDDARREGRPYHASAVQTILRWLDRKGDQGPEDVVDTLITALALWNDPVVAAATEESDFDLAELRSRRMSLFVCGGPADVRLYRPVYGLLFQQLVQISTRHEFGKDPEREHKHRVLGLLDEFWALGKQDVLADAAAFTASYGFRWAYVQQTKAQSVSAFGEQGADNLFNNTGVEIVFGGTDLKTAKQVSERMGFDTVEEVTRNRPRFLGWLHPGRQTEAEAARRRALMLPQEIERLSRKVAIVLRPGLPPLRLDRIEWFKDPAFASLAGAPPPVPTLQVVVERDPEPPAPSEEEVAAQRGEALARDLEVATAQAEGLAEAATEAADRARGAAAHAAALGEQARLARAGATEAARAARAARLAMEEAVGLGVVPAAVQAAADTTARRAEAATAEAARLSSEAAEAVERARAAKLQANAAEREAHKARRRAERVAQALAEVEAAA